MTWGRKVHAREKHLHFLSATGVEADVRRAAKRDSSEAEIVSYLRAAGWSVLYLSVKDGPDLLAGKHGVNVLIENKTGKAKLRPGQKAWGESWRGDPVYVIRTVHEAEALTKAINKLGRSK
jgi:hypothetical protein